MRFLFIFLFILSSKAALCTDEEVNQARFERAVAFEPCSNWWYDFDLGSYVCRWKGQRINLYTSVEVDRIVDKLQAKISQLENRVKTLESKP